MFSWIGYPSESDATTACSNQPGGVLGQPLSDGGNDRVAQGDKSCSDHHCQDRECARVVNGIRDGIDELASIVVIWFIVVTWDVWVAEDAAAQVCLHVEGEPERCPAHAAWNSALSTVGR